MAADTKIIENAYTIDESEAQRHVYVYSETSNMTPHNIDSPVFGGFDDGVVVTDAVAPTTMLFTQDVLSPSDCDLTSMQAQTADGTVTIQNVYDPNTDIYTLWYNNTQYSVTSYGQEIYFGFRVNAVKRETISGGGFRWVVVDSYGYCVYMDSNGQRQFKGLGSGVGAVYLQNTHMSELVTSYLISEAIS